MQPSNFRLDVEDERLWRGDQPVPISNKAFRLLQLFVANPNRLLTKDAILDNVWPGVRVTEGLVKEYVHDLRQALGDDPKRPRFIETVHGRGYRFLGGIEAADLPARGALTHTPGQHTLSLAVLAFTNLSDDPERDYFADGVSEDIIIGLSKNPHLSVISRDSTFAFKDKRVSARDIGADLGARFVLEGSVRMAGRRIRIAANLIDSTSDCHLWAEIYERKLDDIFSVQDEVVSSIVHALGASDGVIERSARRNLAGIPESKLSAYDCYLKAQEHFHLRHGAGYDKAEALYTRAIELDPRLARAYSALAFLHFQRFKVYLTASFESVEQKTLDLALQAVRLDPDDYLAHWVLGRVYSYLRKPAQGLAEFARALQINPNDANVLADFADYLVYSGRTEEALDICQRAIRLNPKCPDWYWWHLGFTYFHLGRYKDALASLEHMTSPGQARRLRAAVYAQLGRLDEAQSEARQFMSVNPGFSVGEWAGKEPYIDPDERQRYAGGLRKAGLPE